MLAPAGLVHERLALDEGVVLLQGLAVQLACGVAAGQLQAHSQRKLRRVRVALAGLLARARQRALALAALQRSIQRCSSRTGGTRSMVASAAATAKGAAPMQRMLRTCLRAALLQQQHTRLQLIMHLHLQPPCHLHACE